MSTNAINTLSGDFYVGMQREEAVKNGNAEATKWYQKDIFKMRPPAFFDEIDLNKNGVLEKDEVLFQRDLEANVKGNVKRSALTGGVILSLCAPALLAASGPIGCAAYALTTIGIFAYGLLAGNGTKEKQQTQAYRMAE